MAAGTIAGSFALAAFAVAIVAGLAANNPASSILGRALIALVICYPIGLGVGMIAHRVVQDHISIHREANPPPEVDEDGAEGAIEQRAVDDEEVLAV